MPIDPMLLRKFHKPGSNVPVQQPKPANPPPSKDIVEVLEEGGFKVAFDIPAREPSGEITDEPRGNAGESQADDSVKYFYHPESDSYWSSAEGEIMDVNLGDGMSVEITKEEFEAKERIIESKEVAVFEEPKVDAGPAFKDRLDLLDSLVNSELGISPYTIDIIRGHVKTIMMDLVTQPELDSILIDRDVHNVLAFIRHVKVDAVEAREKTKEKKQVKESKATRARNFTLDFTALQAAMGGVNPAAGLPMSLEDLSKLK